jgi:hypothetical protein
LTFQNLKEFLSNTRNINRRSGNSKISARIVVVDDVVAGWRGGALADALANQEEVVPAECKSSPAQMVQITKILLICSRHEKPFGGREASIS